MIVCWGFARTAVLLGALLLAPGLSLAHETVPELPFASKQDPLQCGIPQTLGNGVAGLLDGRYEGELVEPEVHLYESHLRSEVVGHLPHGSPVNVTMFQDNPVLNYYYVEAFTETGIVRGWVPEPYLDLSGE